MFATLNSNHSDNDVIRQSLLQNSDSSSSDDSFYVSRDGALATYYKSYEELGIASNEADYRWKAFDAFLRSEEIHCSEVKVGVCGLIAFASVPGSKGSGSLYWFHEPTRSVSSITFDDCIESDTFRTGAHFDLKEFESLYETHNLGRLTGSSAIPTATQKPESILNSEDLLIAA